jgi:hypothetical protein
MGKSLNKSSLLGEIEKIKIIIMPKGERIMKPLTDIQKAIFTSFNLTEKDLQKYIKQ